MKMLGALVALGLLATPAVAQDNCTFTFAVAKEAPDSISDSTAVYFGDQTSVSVEASADSLCRATDADGFDGTATIAVPEGEYTALVRSVGKKGASVTFNETASTRGKGKPVWQESDVSVAPGSTFTVSGTAKGKAQLRLIAAVELPPEE